MPNRNLSDDEAVSGSIQTDLEQASTDGTLEDINYILNTYDTLKVTEVGSDVYYRIPEYNSGDPEVAIVHQQDGTVTVKEFTEFVSKIGNSFMDTISYKEMLGEEISVILENEIYESGGTVYHATPIERAIKIVKSGVIEARNETRSISNRSAGSAVFTDEFAPDNIYGDVVFEISIDDMIADGFKPHAGREPPVEQAHAEETIARMFEIPDYYSEVDPDISRHTIVFYEDLPLKYVSIDCDDTTLKKLREELTEEQCESVGL